MPISIGLGTEKKLPKQQHLYKKEILFDSFVLRTFTQNVLAHIDSMALIMFGSIQNSGRRRVQREMQMSPRGGFCKRQELDMLHPLHLTPRMDLCS